MQWYPWIGTTEKHRSEDPILNPPEFTSPICLSIITKNNGKFHWVLSKFIRGRLLNESLSPKRRAGCSGHPRGTITFNDLAACLGLKKLSVFIKVPILSSIFLIFSYSHEGQYSSSSSIIALPPQPFGHLMLIFKSTLFVTVWLS
jgi:hypothetical protein